MSPDPDSCTAEYKSLKQQLFTRKDKVKPMIVGLDVEKAFDTIKWEFLFEILGKMCFHDRFVRIIQTLYDKHTARIKGLFRLFCFREGNKTETQSTLSSLPYLLNL